MYKKNYLNIIFVEQFRNITYKYCFVAVCDFQVIELASWDMADNIEVKPNSFLYSCLSPHKVSSGVDSLYVSSAGDGLVGF